MEVEVVRYHNLPIGPVIKTAFFLQRTSCLLPLYGHASNGTYKSTNTYQYDTNHLAGKNLSLIKKNICMATAKRSDFALNYMHRPPAYV